MTNEPHRELLTEAERAEYRRFDDMKNLTFRESIRYRSPSFIILGIWLALSIILFIVALTSADNAKAADTVTRGEETTTTLMLGIVVLGGGAGVVVILLHNATRALVLHREAFLKRIGYADRVKIMSEGDDYSPTRRQSWHAWYEDRSELNWQDRVRAEMHGGMDVDSYINNVAEHDKD